MAKIVQIDKGLQDLVGSHIVCFSIIFPHKSAGIICNNLRVSLRPAGFGSHCINQSDGLFLPHPGSGVRDRNRDRSVLGDSIVGGMIHHKQSRAQQALPVLTGQTHQKIKGGVNF